MRSIAPFSGPVRAALLWSYEAKAERCENNFTSERDGRAKSADFDEADGQTVAKSKGRSLGEGGIHLWNFIILSSGSSEDGRNSAEVIRCALLMTRHTPRQSRQGHAVPGAQPANHCRAVVRVDGTAIRKKIKKDYEKALRDLENSRRVLPGAQPCCRDNTKIRRNNISDGTALFRTYGNLVLVNGRWRAMR
jgi:hypothetical protein